MNYLLSLLSLALLLCLPSAVFADLPAASRVKAAIEYMRDKTSYSEATMTVHRPTWERSSSLKAWTQGLKTSLVRFTAPVKDAGNGSLTIDEEMWTYNPKTNRIIKIPPSMKTQNWMGSDFSYEDLSKGDDIIDDYDHKEISVELSDGQRIYIIESIPKEDAPVVWGKESLKIREDNIVIEHNFYDQDGKLVKVLTATEIQVIGGKKYATRLRMENLEKPGEWTEIHTHKAEFNIPISDSVFTQSNLSSPRT